VTLKVLINQRGKATSHPADDTSGGSEGTLEYDHQAYEEFFYRKSIVVVPIVFYPLTPIPMRTRRGELV
jgi:hypothetical protein